MDDNMFDQMVETLKNTESPSYRLGYAVASYGEAVKNADEALLGASIDAISDLLREHLPGFDQMQYGFGGYTSTMGG